MSLTPAPQLVSKAPETLAERFWSLARGMEPDAGADDPVAVVEHVLAVLDKLDAGEVGGEITVNTLSFLALLRQHEVRGDLLYASPEQIRGETMDQRSLVFSVGVLLFEKLTGRHPFGAEGNPNRVARMRRGELASGVNFFPKVPAELRTVLVKAMGPFPEERFASLDELRGRLEAYVGGRLTDVALVASPKPARLPAVPERDSVWPRELDDPKPVFRNRLARPRSYAPALWMVLGAAVASIAFALAWPRGETTAAAAPPATERASAAPTSAAPAPAAPAPTTPSAAAPSPAVVAIAPTAPVTEAPASDEIAAPPAPREPVARAEPAPAARFDADIGAENALAAARECFGVERLADGVEFGATLVYASADGLSRKIYYSAADGLSRDERRCVSRALIGISAGAAPTRTTLVAHSFYLHGGGGRVKARVAD